MYWERVSRVLSEYAGIRIEKSTEKPECLQLIKLVANLALISRFLRKILMITRRRYSDIL